MGPAHIAAKICSVTYDSPIGRAVPTIGETDWSNTPLYFVFSGMIDLRLHKHRPFAAFAVAFGLAPGSDRRHRGTVTPEPSHETCRSRYHRHRAAAAGLGRALLDFSKVTTDTGITGWGECYASSVGPEAMRHVIRDVFERHMLGENPENIELMFRRAYSSGFTQRPDLTVMGAFSGLEIACWDILGKDRDRPVLCPAWVADE